MIKDCTLIEALYCKETDTVKDVAQLLRQHLIRYVYVTNDHLEPVGVISITDINNRAVAEGKDPNSTTAQDIMSSPITSFDEQEDARTVYKACIDNKFPTCPITRDRKIIGIITIQELLRKVTHL